MKVEENTDRVYLGYLKNIMRSKELSAIHSYIAIFNATEKRSLRAPDTNGTNQYGQVKGWIE